MERTDPVWNLSSSIVENTVQSAPLTETLAHRSQATSLLFVDSSVRDNQDLVAGASPQTEVHVLNSSQDAISQIGQILAGRTGIESLQILSHGQSAGLKLGESWLDATSLSRHTAELQSWSTSLTQDADILVFGCEIAQGETGKAFIQQLASLTQADIAASDDLTGSSALGGDWDLEFKTGSIEAQSAIASIKYDHILNLSPDLQITGITQVYNENGVPITVDIGASVNDNSADFNGGRLSVAFVQGMSSDIFSMRQLSGISLDGRIVSYNGKRIGYMTNGYGESKLTVTFDTPDATLDAVRAVLKNISYINATDDLVNDENREVEFIISDGKGGVSTPGRKKVFMYGANDAPYMGGSVVLYDGKGSPTHSPWLVYQDSKVVSSGSATAATVEGGTQLTTDRDIIAGYSNYSLSYNLNPTNPSITTSLKNANFPMLDRSKGFNLSFKLQLNAENHDNSDRNFDGRDDRAGFSVVLIGDDLKGIELGFWGDRIIVQEDATTQIDKTKAADGTDAGRYRTLFTQGEFTRDLNPAIMNQFDLSIVGDIYTLYRAGRAILSGRVRDYSSYVPAQIAGVTPPSNYKQKNFVFLGDNTRSASATAVLGEVSISTATLALPSLKSNRGETIAIPAIKMMDVDTYQSAVSLTLSAINGNINVLDSTNVTINGNGSKNVNISGTVDAIRRIVDNSKITYTSVGQFTGSDNIKLTLDDKVGGKVERNLSVTVLQNVTNELYWHNQQTGEVSTWTLKDGVLQGYQTLKVVPTIDWQMEAIADFDSDGDKDILWRNRTTGENSFWRMNGNQYLGSVNLLQVGDLNWQIEAVGDLVGTSSKDILWRNKSTGEVSVWELNQMSLLDYKLMASSPIDRAWEIEGIGNFLSGGKQEVLWRNRNDGTVVFWEVQALNATTQRYDVRSQFLYTLSDFNWQITQTYDANGDGIDEIGWYNSATQQNSMWSVISGNSINPVLLPQQESGQWTLEQVIDLNGDLQLDYIWRDRQTGLVEVWQLNPWQTYGTAPIRKKIALATVGDVNWQIEEGNLQPA
jgi:Domain of unknown function (DUF4347)